MEDLEARKEIERLRGELAAATNVLVGIIRDTLVARPDIALRILGENKRGIEALENQDASPFAKEGAKRFYHRYATLVSKSISHDA